jgi:hypothetical protein
LPEIDDDLFEPALPKKIENLHSWRRLFGEGGQPEEENEGLPIFFLPLLGLPALSVRRQRFRL